VATSSKWKKGCALFACIPAFVQLICAFRYVISTIYKGPAGRYHASVFPLYLKNEVYSTASDKPESFQLAKLKPIYKEVKDGDKISSYAVKAFESDASELAGLFARSCAALRVPLAALSLSLLLFPRLSFQYQAPKELIISEDDGKKQGRLKKGEDKVAQKKRKGRRLRNPSKPKKGLRKGREKWLKGKNSLKRARKS
jgi:hypothetical protein